MVEYRVTKYNPRLRDSRGAYLVDEWTSATDVGRAFGGVILTAEEYRRVEQAYIRSAVAFLREGGITSLRVQGLENHRGLALTFGEGSVFPVDEIGDLIARILRDEFWCRLEGRSGFLHFGWDYYMYVGVPERCMAAEQVAQELGLYAEEFESPYKDEADC